MYLEAWESHTAAKICHDAMGRRFPQCSGYIKAPLHHDEGKGSGRSFKAVAGSGGFARTETHTVERAVSITLYFFGIYAPDLAIQGPLQDDKVNV